MSTARDIALIILIVQAFFFSLIPLTLFGGMAYGVFWLRPRVIAGLRQAFEYAEMAREYVERVCAQLVAPFLWVHGAVRMVTTIAASGARQISKNTCKEVGL